MRIRFLQQFGANSAGSVANIDQTLAYELIKHGVAAAAGASEAPAAIETATAPAPERAIERPRRGR